MVKKNLEGGGAKISKLPIEPSESPLVIDLPDGQKIIVGKLQEGTVIEVATWHGTGRPDSRTNRFMLGMTTGQTDVSSPTGFSSDVPETESLTRTKVGIVINLGKSLLRNLGQPLRTSLKKSRELDPVDTTTDLEITAWLDSLKNEVSAEIPKNPVKSSGRNLEKLPPRKNQLKTNREK